MIASVKTIVQSVESLIRRGKRDQARKALTDALKQYPREALLWYWMARCLPKQDQALDALRRALQYDPSLEEAQELFVWVQTGGNPTEWESASEVAPAAPPPASTWSLLSELGDDDVPFEPPSTPVTSAPETLSLLEEMESQNPSVTSPYYGMGMADSAPTTEESLWNRATYFIGEPLEEPIIAMEPPRGQFSFADAPPSPAESIPVRNSLSPLTAEQVNTLIAEEEKPKGKAKPAKPAPVREEKVKVKTPPSPTMKSLRSLLTLAAIVGVILLILWATLRFNLLPESVVNASPMIATPVSDLHLRLSPPPTPFPASDWIAEAQDNRMNNRLTQAEGLLAQGVASDPNNLLAKVMLSEVLREEPGKEADALAVAEDAFASVSTLEERALAAEALVWAIARQPQPDVARAQVAAEQAAAEVPNSPHAQWARAMSAALLGNTGEAESAATLAAALDTSLPASVKAARQAEVMQRAGNADLAAQLYEKAINDLNYVPWRVQFIAVLRAIEADPVNSPRIMEQLSEIRTADPDNPILGQ